MRFLAFLSFVVARSNRDRCPSVSKRGQYSTRSTLLSLWLIGGLLRRDQDRQTAISWRNSVVSIREKSGKPGEEEGAELRATRSKTSRAVGRLAKHLDGIQEPFSSNAKVKRREEGWEWDNERGWYGYIAGGEKEEGFPTPRGENREKELREREGEPG